MTTETSSALNVQKFEDLVLTRPEPYHDQTGLAVYICHCTNLVSTFGHVVWIDAESVYQEVNAIVTLTFIVQSGNNALVVEFISVIKIIASKH